MEEFNFRIGNIELRSCGKHLFVDGVVHDRAEIVEWFGDTCVTIGHFQQNSEGFDFKFVGCRPLSMTVNWDNLKQLIVVGYDRLMMEIGYE